MFNKFSVTDEKNGISYLVKGTYEKAFAEAMNVLSKEKKICWWSYEPETFRFVYMNKSRRYTPDFLVTLNDRREVYVEVKGHMNPRSIASIKRFKKNFPEELYVVIDRKFFSGGEKLRRITNPEDVLEELNAASTQRR